MLLLGSSAMATQLAIQPLAHIPNALRSRDDVKRWWSRATLLEIADPEFAPGELPFDIGTFLIPMTKEMSSIYVTTTIKQIKINSQRSTDRNGSSWRLIDSIVRRC